MVVEGGEGVFQDADLQKALEADLEDAQAAVHDKDRRRQQKGKGMTRLEGQQGQEKAHRAATGVPHQDGGGLGVDPQIGQQRAHEHRRRGDVAAQLFAVEQREGAHADHRQTGGQAVHAVGAVDHIDAGPDQNHDQQQVDRVGQQEVPL